MGSRFFVFNDESVLPEYRIDAQRIEIDPLSLLPIKNEDRVCISSEACLEAVYEKMEEGARKRAVDLLKNKFLFRKAIAPLFPEFRFYKTSLEALEPVHRKSILKPVKGFFSAGVRVIDAGEDLQRVKDEISQEIKTYSAYFPESVLSTEEWLVEDFIEGEEIAVDLFFDAKGSPVILNITQHPMPLDPHYLNAVYWTSQSLFRRWKAPLETFFLRLNRDLLGVSHFPLHAEFRIQGEVLVPIEINPLRFGGFGLADLPYHSFGLNPYNLFFKNQTPDWERVWSRVGERYFCWALGYNGKGIDVNRHTPDHEAFLDFCGKEQVMFYKKMDWQKGPVFAMAYLRSESDQTIKNLQSVNFNRFFERASPELQGGVYKHLFGCN